MIHSTAVGADGKNGLTIPMRSHSSDGKWTLTPLKEGFCAGFRRIRKKLEIKACESLRNEAYFLVRRSDEGYA
ncbi:hypothetical protein DESC_300019 [Desulfosarcina cetonica]|nr:hypothetical protein DESC_300019 [Desulfosarcina cetonica]